MKKCRQVEIFSFFILSMHYVSIIMAQNSPCGDWEPYNDEKCFKIFDKVVMEQEVEKICNQYESGATLITIHSKDEQDFLTNFIFKTHGIVDAVWIGAKYNGQQFKWIDNTDFSFTNWAEGSPSNKSEKTCVQMISEGSLIGKWSDQPCSKSDKAVCQKVQNWPNVHLQETILNVRKELQELKQNFTKQLNNQQSIINSQQITIKNLNESVTKQLNSQQSLINNNLLSIKILNENVTKQLNSQQTIINSQQLTIKNLNETLTNQLNSQQSIINSNKLSINNLNENVTKQMNNQQQIINGQQLAIKNLKDNLVPVNFIYIQLPSQPEPKTLWPTVEWKDVSSDYGGLFFRAEGGKSSKFGEVQNEDSPRLVGVRHVYDTRGADSLDIQPGTWSNAIYLSQTGNGDQRSMSFLVSNAEVVPRNMAIRFWKRIN